MRLDLGRTGQKARTRSALLAAARQLLDKGEPVTINAAADTATVSRATAYRYFSDPDVLTLEAVLDGSFATPEEAVGDAVDVRERVHRVRRRLLESTRASEQRFRLFLARALEASARTGGGGAAEARAGRRLPMFAYALEPVRERMTAEAFEFLVLSLSAVTGLESFIALEDVCRVDPEQAEAISAAVVDAILDRQLPRDTARGSRPAPSPA